MPINLFKHSALSYLNQWYVTDRHFMKEISAESKSDQLGDAFRRLAIAYVVVRNFHIADIKKNKELQEKFWNNVATKVCNSTLFEDSPTKEDVNFLAKSLGQYTKSSSSNLISAATKFLWFSGYHNIRIYDKRAVKALNDIRKITRKKSFRVDGDYKAFAAEWDSQFEINLAKIDLVIKELPDILAWSIIPSEDHNAALQVIKEKWFKERVLDKYLWTKGEEKDE